MQIFQHFTFIQVNRVHVTSLMLYLHAYRVYLTVSLSLFVGKFVDIRLTLLDEDRAYAVETFWFFLYLIILPVIELNTIKSKQNNTKQ
jgi:uncharacterized membrane protein YczE